MNIFDILVDSLSANQHSVLSVDDLDYNSTHIFGHSTLNNHS